MLFEAQREILGPHPCTIIRVRAVISPLKNHCQSAYHVEGKFETRFWQFVDIGADRQTLLTWVRLRLRLRAALDFELQVLPIFSSGIVQPAKRQRAWKSPHTRKARRGGEREKFFSLAAASRFSRAGWFSRARARVGMDKKKRETEKSLVTRLPGHHSSALSTTWRGRKQLYISGLIWCRSCVF